MDIIQQFHDLRVSRGMSLRDLADKAGTSYSRICDIENGKTCPTIDAMNRLLKPLDAELTIKALE